MNSICCSPPHRPDPNAVVTVISESSRSSLNARSSAEISLITADGNKVTLSAGSSLRAEHITYDYLGRIQGQALAGRTEELQISTANEFAITVEGALDQEELSDINKLLDAFETTADDFFRGKPDLSVESFANLGEIDSIASFDAALSYSREALAERATNITSIANASGAPVADATDTAPANTRSEPRSTQPFLSSLAQLARRLEDEKGLDKLPRRFTELLLKLAHNLAPDEQQQSLSDRIPAEHSRRRSGLEYLSAVGDLFGMSS